MSFQTYIPITPRAVVYSRTHNDFDNAIYLQIASSNRIRKNSHSILVSSQSCRRRRYTKRFYVKTKNQHATRILETRISHTFQKLVYSRAKKKKKKKYNRVHTHTEATSNCQIPNQTHHINQLMHFPVLSR